MAVELLAISLVSVLQSLASGELSNLPSRYKFYDATFHGGARSTPGIVTTCIRGIGGAYGPCNRYGPEDERFAVREGIDVVTSLSTRLAIQDGLRGIQVRQQRPPHPRDSQRKVRPMDPGVA
jgi:hypothetical protein